MQAAVLGRGEGNVGSRPAERKKKRPGKTERGSVCRWMPSGERNVTKVRKKGSRGKISEKARRVTF